VDGVETHSLLEKRHACLLSLLNVKWSRDAPTVHGILLSNGRTTSYTPDFVVDMEDEGGTERTCLVEIKPRYPYDDELRKARGACSVLKGTPLFLFYNTRFRSPFSSRPSSYGQGDYGHHEGVRGIRMEWRGGRVLVEHDAAYACDPPSSSSPFSEVRGWLGVREEVGDVRFDNVLLSSAYEEVDRFPAPRPE
jgi:hypothetical protein